MEQKPNNRASVWSETHWTFPSPSHAAAATAMNLFVTTLLRPALLLLLATAAFTLSACQVAHQAWGEAYRHKGGYYEDTKTKPQTHAEK